MITVFILSLISGYYCAQEGPMVETPLGTVAGSYQTSFEGRTFSAFEGIPYAKPPVGELRFEEPEPVEPWTGVWNATTHVECAQTLMLQANSTKGDEDCLHINVYLPRETINPEEKLNVLVVIHGGAYMYSSSYDFFSPNFLMDRDMILVTFNYRLGILGFLSTEDDVVPGNNGLKDQVVALKWIQENVASFGGNPDSVTLIGGSAGASSVHFHYFSEQSEGLFHRGWSQSGCALDCWSIAEEPLSKARKLADSVGCLGDSTRDLVDCLKEKPFEEILEKMPLFFAYSILPLVPFGPVVEKGGSEPFLTENPYELLKKGQVRDLPWIASTTIQEGFVGVDLISDFDYIDENWEELAPSILEFNYTLDPNLWKNASQEIKELYYGEEKINAQNMLKLVQMFTDRGFTTDGELALRLQANLTTSPVYSYIFAYPGDTTLDGYVRHGAESRYLFGVFNNNTTPLSSEELKMKDYFIDFLNSFSKTGVPSFGSTEWKPTTYDQLIYLNITGVEHTDLKLETAEELSDRSFWKSLHFSENENLDDRKM